MTVRIIKRGDFPRGSDPAIGRTTHPSASAPQSFFDRDGPRRAEDLNVAAVDADADFGNCAQCGAPQSLSEAETCWLCTSDNRLNQQL